MVTIELEKRMILVLFRKFKETPRDKRAITYSDFEKI